jgi:hypothetical protein
LEIVQKEWKDTPFEPIFGKEKRYWDERAKLLSKVRNPLAHNRDEVLRDDERHLAEAYCHEILDTLRRARENPALDYLD